MDSIRSDGRDYLDVTVGQKPHLDRLGRHGGPKCVGGFEPDLELVVVVCRCKKGSLKIDTGARQSHVGAAVVARGQPVGFVGRNGAHVRDSQVDD